MPSELFWNSVLVTSSALFLAVLAMLYKSKCKNIDCCGCHIERDVEAEEKYDEKEMEMKYHNIEHKNNSDL